jgi:hypothetical protein
MTREKRAHSIHNGSENAELIARVAESKETSSATNASSAAAGGQRFSRPLGRAKRRIQSAKVRKLGED